MNVFDWSLLKLNLKRYCRYIVCAIVLFLLLDQVGACSQTVRWPLVMIRRPFYQILYATGQQKIPLSEKKQVYTDYQDPNPKSKIHLRGYDILKTFVVHYQGYGKVGYLDTNDSLIKGWYLSSMNKKNSWTYKKVAPYDLLIVFGRMAEPVNFDNIEFNHGENIGFIRIKKKGIYWNTKDYENIHVIPANNRILKGVSLLHHGDDVYLEGYLIDWDSVDSPREDLYYQTARRSGDFSKQLAGGQRTLLCFQLYLTKLILNGYVYQ